MPRSLEHSLASDVWIVRVLPKTRQIRLAAPSVTGNPKEAERLKSALRQIAGVERVTANLRSGRLMVRHRADSPVLDFFARLPACAVERPRRSRRGTPSRSADPARTAWHSLDRDEVVARLQSSLEGLSGGEVARRTRVYGANLLEDISVRTRLEILLAQVANFPTGLLLGASSLSTLLGDLVDAAAILGVVGLNSVIGYTMERRNEDLLASWRKLEAGQARVIRNGVLERISAEDLVPGDLLLVKAGDICPADARVIDAHRLTCNEAPLTGESEPRRKDPQEVPGAATLAERSSMLFAGTVVSGGRGRAIVTATGGRTELCQIGRLLQETQAPVASLQERLAELGNRFAAVGLGGAVLAGAIGTMRGRPLVRTIRNAVALGVGSIPEGLPVVTTAALVRSMQRMRERGIVVRRLSSAETLGRVSVICTDKTGTLTQNDMALEVLEVCGEALDPADLRLVLDDIPSEPVATALAAVALSSDVDVRQRGAQSEIVGSATEKALVRAAESAGLAWAGLRRRFPRLSLRERADGRHYVVSVHESGGAGALAFIKGAPEQVLRLCARTPAGRLDARSRRAVRARNAALAAEGLRVLAVGWRRLRDRGSDVGRGGFTFLGLVGLRDPVREGAADAVHAAAGAGIRTVILTGDQHRTAESVARLVGLEGRAVDGAEVARHLARGDLAVLEDVAVLSRITPAQKLEVVRALQRQGHVVAMAGDGINDAPALKTADVGIAVGVRSSDLAREAADLVLAGDDLRSILSAVSEGRIVYDNLRTAVRYLMATNSSELALVLGNELLGGDELLSSRQLLWINLLSDTLPALALALEPGDPSVLARPPVDPRSSLLPASARIEVARDGLLLAGIGGAGWLAGGREAAFSALLGAQLGYAAVCRAGARPPTPQFAALMGSAIALQGAALFVPPLRYLLGMRAVPAASELIAFGVGLATPWLLSTALRDGEVVRTKRPPASESFERTSSARRRARMHPSTVDRTGRRPARRSDVAARAHSRR